MSSSFQHQFERYKTRVDLALKQQLGSFTSPYSSNDSSVYLQRLEQATGYSLLSGGKRVRPVLVYSAAAAINTQCDEQTLDQIACSIEMIHAYSLIHDDLPAMDDDDLRRGKPTCHKAFDEATAILVGDLLQSRAFENLTELSHCPADKKIELVKTLSRACGQRGMVGGQAIDLYAMDQSIDIAHLETLHRLKTGALIRAAVAMGAIYAGANKVQLLALDDYAQAIGLAFQVQDDILDIEGDTLTLGKTQGADLAMNKPTYPSLLGLDGAKAKLKQLHQQALGAVSVFDTEANTLRQLSEFIISRSY
jgi:geranylgeranyl pyrophosphate synthase